MEPLEPLEPPLDPPLGLVSCKCMPSYVPGFTLCSVKKAISGTVLMSHNDVYPNEICPTMNRCPSFVNLGDKDDELLSR